MKIAYAPTGGFRPAPGPCQDSLPYPADMSMSCHRSALAFLLLSGCASQTTLTLLDHIPPPPRDAAAATARCSERPDHALTDVRAELDALQKQEQAGYSQISAAARAANDAGNGYEKRHAQAALALKKKDEAIHQAAAELSVRMDQSAGAAKRTLDDVLDNIDSSERPQLALCVLVQVDGRWQPRPDCAAPVLAAAKTARKAAADRYLVSAQQVWEGWRTDAETTLQDWTKLPDGIPDTDDPYVQVAVAGYRRAQEDMLRQLMQASTNLCGLAARAAAHPDPAD